MAAITELSELGQRRLTLRTCVDNLDAETETAGFDQPLGGLEHWVGMAGSILRDGGAGHPGSLRELGPREPCPFPRLADCRPRRQAKPAANARAEGQRVLCTSRIVALHHSPVACAPMRLATNQYVRFAIHAAAIAAMNPIMPMNSGPPSVRNEMGTIRSRYAS